MAAQSTPRTNTRASETVAIQQLTGLPTGVIDFLPMEIQTQVMEMMVGPIGALEYLSKRLEDIREYHKQVVILINDRKVGGGYIVPVIVPLDESESAELVSPRLKAMISTDNFVTENGNKRRRAVQG